MSNPVQESLVDWNPDAGTNDTNLPTSGSNAGTGQSQELAGNLRLLKSEIRAESLIKSWERWKGLQNLAGSADIVFSFVDSANFVVNDNFLHANRNIAVVGRRVRAFLSGSVIYGTIAAAIFSSPSTTIQVHWDSGSLDATLTEVQFGPERNAVPHPQVLLLTNLAGAGLVPGDVVVYHPTTAFAVTVGVGQASLRQFLVARHAIGNGVIGEFISHGLVSMNVAGPVTAGHYIINDGVAAAGKDSGIAQGATTAPPLGAFAIAVETNAGAGTNLVAVILLGHTVSMEAVASTSNGFGTRFLDDVDPVLGDMEDGDLWYVHD